MALLNSSIKIVKKIVANTLAPKLQTLVGDYHFDFIAQKNIREGIMVAQETIHQTRKTKTNSTFSIRL